MVSGPQVATHRGGHREILSVMSSAAIVFLATDQALGWRSAGATLCRLSLKKAVNAALQSAERAVLKAETAAERRFASVNEFRQTLSDQVTGSVRWVETINYLLDNVGCNLLIELGPGQVLTGLVGRIRKGTEVISIENLNSLRDALPLIRAAST